MLLAYIDEIGSTGAFIHPSHPRFSDSPAFGYGGFIIPEENAREFGAYFAERKKEFFRNEIPADTDPGRWEKKGSDLLFARVAEEMPQNLRLLGSLISKLKRLDGNLFYYAEEKPIGSPKETNCGPAEFRMREETAMRETLNRIARHADFHDSRVLVMMDQINEKSRIQRLPTMYAHILGRASEHREMKRIIEPPMHIDSGLSTNIQFADWICSLAKRAIEFQLVEDSRYNWIPKAKQLSTARGSFTYESKLRLHFRAVDDLNHSEILYPTRPLFDSIPSGTLHEENMRKLARVRAATLRDLNQ
ncbi:DUF3800 domain-containing protein [Corynebacterium sp. SCR221107]|uniref:DUF3800 domain-containing protein n=1 Tax=Corynebacterium sp. SCR221107 TaxID=3017361 RepID=UPI0022EC5064|nr:DUF3800 domain-containing protein [Corynebacterium sp. SCR221107]WBT08705.1 DUF3800 domain-containing protein [Corynebacterium sp. SCR221107]